MRDLTVDITDLFLLVDAYTWATETPEKRVSGRIFDDNRRLDDIRSGRRGMTIANWNKAILWFAANWPDTAVWPPDVVRPDKGEFAKLEASQEGKG